MANGYDPAAFDIIREEYEDRREAPERPERDRDREERVREDDRDALEAQRLADDLLIELEKLSDVDGEAAVNDLLDLAVDTNDEFLELGLAKLTATRPRNLRNERSRRGRTAPGRRVISRSRQFSRSNILPPLQKPKKKRKKDPKMAKALKEANRKCRTIKGKMRKGKCQADIMKMAHKLKRKM
jgi:hypothetical protein